jgi:protein gp37
MGGEQMVKTTTSWNPFVGCTKLSPGCKNCYMFRIETDFGRNPKVVRRTGDKIFYAPLKWEEPDLILTCSMSDWFHPDADQWRSEAWRIVRQTPHLIYRILTKRPERILGHLPEDWGPSGYENVWLAVSVELQQYVSRMDILRTIPAKLRWVSAEPLLGPLNLDLTGFKWVVAGGESDREAPRPSDPQWFRDLRDQCARERKAFLFLSHGGSKPCRCGCRSRWGCRKLDGQIYEQFPVA